MNDKKRVKYTLNDRYFSQINKDSAYWLGVLYADGNVSTNLKNTTGRVIFSSTDKEWVEMFVKDIEYEGPIRREFHKIFKKPIWKVTITSRLMYEDLFSLGCVPKKSLILKFPNLDKSFIPHFIRGYFDGDGSVTVCQNLKSNDWKILKSSFSSGSEDFIRSLLDFLPTKNRNYYKGKNIFELKFSLNDSIALYNFMYNDCSKYLERKFLKFKNYIDNYQPKRGSTTIIDQLTKLKE